MTLPLATVLFLGTGRQDPEPLRVNGTLRLAEHLAAARVESPLNEVEAAADPGDLDPAALDLMLEEGFEDFEFEYAGWTGSPGVSAAREGDRGVLRISRPVNGSYGWVLPVRSDAFYRFERSVRVDGDPFCDWRVVESRLDFEDVRLDVDTQFLAGRGSALKIHSLPIEEGGSWQTASTSFYPTPRTRSLVVILRPGVGADPGAILRGMSFDDIRLEEVVPGSTERMRLLKGANLANDADAALGMRKAGLLLPLPSPDVVREGEAAESNYTWRQALYAPPKTEIAFEVELPEGAVLRLATGLARETPQGAAARFEVEFLPEGAEAPEVVYERVRTARMEEWSWEDADVDLSRFGGRAGTLVLRTGAEEGDPHPLWSNPRIETPGTTEDPMVILIAVDTLRADHLSSYGYERATSPALDRLASDGVRFDQARSNCNWTCPSFASIFTGLVPARHGVSSYGPATPLPDELVTLAEYFSVRGFDTHSIAYKVPLFDGNYEQGFDEAFNVPRDFLRGEENVARALEWLETHRGGPSFLFLHFNDPHQPFIQPEPFDRSFGPGPEAHGVTLPIGTPAAGQEDLQQLFRDLYDGAVAYVDDCIGQFLSALRERDLYDRATIAFVADHGEQLWEHGRFGHGGDDLYDEVVRVPLIVKPPRDTIEAGLVVEAAVRGFDVMPTLLELGGIAPPKHIDAHSLVPLLRGEEETGARIVVTETSQRGMALVDGGFKLVLYPDGGPESLYDLASDPRETRDVHAQHPDEVKRLRELAIAYVLEHRPGNFLVARTGSEAARLTIASPAVRSLAGASAITYSGTRGAVVVPAGTLALLELEGADAARAAVEGLPERGASGELPIFEPGQLASLAGVGLWRFRGTVEPTRRGGAEEGSEPIDPELLEALRRLGYAE